MSVQTEKTTARDIILAEPPDWEAILGLPALALSNPSEAAGLKSCLDEAGRLSNKDVRLAVLYYAMRKKAQAAEHADKAGGHGVAAIITGMLAEENNRLEDALKAYQKAAQAEPTLAPCALKPIDVLRKLGRIDEAAALVEKHRKQFSDKADLWFYEGCLLEEAGKYQAALDCYEKALEISPDSPGCLFRAAYLADLRGLDDEAKDYYRQIVASDPFYISACLNLALIHEDDEEYDEAIICCRRALRHDPTNRRAKLFLSNAEAAATMYYSPEETKQSERLEAILRVPVSDFELSVRSRNCLANMNIQTLGDLVKKTESEMLAYKNFGETSLREIKDMLTAKGLRLGMMREDAATRQAMERQRRNANQELLSKTIDELDLGVRSRKCMETLGIATIGDLVAKSEPELVAARNFGRVSLNEIKKRLSEMGLALRDSKKDG